jgi:hypothetical protein
MLHLPRAQARTGFTLVEIVAALGAFSIAFLAGFAAIGALMIRQDINYRSTVAGSAAILLLRNDSGTTMNTTLRDAVMVRKSVPAGTKFRGYPVADTPPAAGSDIYTFTSSTAVVKNGVWSEYRAVLMTDTGSRATFWYGAPEEIEADRSTTLDFLGAYDH